MKPPKVTRRRAFAGAAALAVGVRANASTPFSVFPGDSVAPESDPVATAALAVDDHRGGLDHWLTTIAGRLRDSNRDDRLMTPAQTEKMITRQADYLRGSLEAAEGELVALLSERPGVAVRAGGKVYGEGRVMAARRVDLLVRKGGGR